MRLHHLPNVVSAILVSKRIAFRITNRRDPYAFYKHFTYPAHCLSSLFGSLCLNLYRSRMEVCVKNHGWWFALLYNAPSLFKLIIYYFQGLLIFFCFLFFGNQIQPQCTAARRSLHPSTA